MKTKYLMVESYLTWSGKAAFTVMTFEKSMIIRALLIIIGFMGISMAGKAQTLTITSGGQSGTSGTNWSISGVTLTVTGAANIQGSVIQNHLTNTGPLTIVGNTTNFQVSVNESINVVTGSNDLVFGASDNQGGITITGAISIAGSISFYGGDILINQNLNTTAGGSGGNVYLKASGDIVLEDSKSITTNGGDVVLWANSDGGTTNGGVFLDQSSSIVTAGGHIWIGGGSGSTSWNGLAVGDGYAVSGRNLENDFAVRTAAKINWDAGVLLNETSLDSGGGNIYIAGQRNTRNNHDGGAGIINYSGTAGTTINAGSGTIEIAASGNYSAGTNGFMTGLHPTQVTGGLTLTSTNTSTTDAISISASTLTTSNAGIFAEGNTQFLSTSVTSGGGISIIASSAAGTGWGTWVQVGSLIVLSASGAINLNAGNSGLGLHPSTGTGFLYLGSKAGTAVTSSTADLTIKADRIVASTGSSINVASSGSLTVESAASSFSQSVSNSQWAIGASLTALTIGKEGNTGTIDINTALTIAGPIAIYGGDINIDQNLDASPGAADGDILLKASGNIVQNAIRTITTDGGDVIFWANSDDQMADGGVFFKSGSTISTSGGHIWIGGGSSGIIWNGLTVGDGWAVSGRSVSDMGYNQPGDWQSGVAFNQMTLQSGGGDIYVAGQRNMDRTDQVGAGVANYSGTGTLIDAGTGTVVIKGDNTAAGNGVFGLMTGLHPNQYSGTFTVKSSNTTAAQAITLSGTTSAGIGDGILIEKYTRLLSTAVTNGGGIAISGSATGGRNAMSVGIGSNAGTLEILSASGDIDINVGIHPLLIANLGIFRLGSISGDADVSNSIANITLTSNNPAWTGNVPVRTNGVLIVTPTLNGSFSSTFNTNSLNYTGITGLTIGNSTNTANILIGSATSIAGPIDIYGGTITLNDDLTSTNDGDISLYTDNAIGGLSSSRNITAAGIFRYIPQGNSFTGNVTFPITNLSVSSAGLIIGKNTNTAKISIGSSTAISGPITLYGGDLAINAALTATNNTINLHATGSVTQTSAITANGLGLHGTGTFTLTNTGNNVTTIAGGDNTTKLGSLSYVDASGGLTIGSVNPSGITASGPILIETLTGDITVSNSVTTTDTTADAIIINAGKSSAIGTSAGGDIKISGSPTVMTGVGGIAKLFSGSEPASTGLTTLAGGSANVQYLTDETTLSFNPALQGDNVYALYRVANKPDAPTNLVATPGVGQIAISYTAGADNGSPITNYEYSLDGTNWITFSPAVTGTAVTVTSLTSGTQYTILLRAVNIAGAGASSAPVTATTIGVPAAPTNLVATPGITQMAISYTAGADNGSPITNYEYSLDGTNWTAFSPAVTGTAVTVTSLTNGTQYTILLRAVNIAGAGASSAPVTATTSSVPPDAPTNLVATPCGSQVSISFTSGADGGSPITNYQYSLDGTNWTTFSPAVTGTTVTITTLSNGTYNIKLRAVNSVGSGAASTSVTSTIDNTVSIAYTGATISTTTNKSANITLSATVTLPAGANASQQAQVRFINRDTGQPISGWLSITAGTQPNSGTASYQPHTLTLGTYEIFRKYSIGIEVGGNGCFTRNNPADNVVITVADPGCGCY